MTVGKTNNAILPALIAVGGHFAATPATAIELGEINVQSTLGQPLRASIAYALAPNEELANYCVALKSGLANSGLPTVTRANISVGDGVIVIAGMQKIREPLMTLRVDVACRYTPHISREYTLFIDPPALAAQALVVEDTTVANPPAVEAKPDVVAAVRSVPAAPRRAPVSRAPILDSESYLVQPGDSLSFIASRIQNRPVGLWDAVTQLFEANPAAFIDNDPDKLKAGSTLIIPDFGVQAVSSVAAEVAEPTTTRDAADKNTTAETNITDNSAPDIVESTQPESTSPMVDVRPDDVILDRENPFVTVDDSSVVIPDTELNEPTTANSPNVPVATIVTPQPAPQATTNWLLWLVGGGLALVIALLVFGRKGLGRGVPAPAVDTPARPMRRSSDTKTVEVLEQVHYDISDDSPTEENLTLDANLEVGTGFGSGVDIDVAEDFGYSTALDLELPEEKDAGDTTVGTDALPTPMIEQSSILESEILPDDDDYDMSVIVDATKMPHSDDVTEHDLKAVVVEGKDETLITDSYTVNQEVDYHILEQDYEDELTATQALSLEIEKAVTELAKNAEDDGTDEETARKQLASITGMDVPANDEIGDTAEITQEIVAEDQTVEMPMSDHDDTIEMTVESGKVDTKAG